MCRRVGAASVDEAFPGRLRRVRAPGIPIPAGRCSTAPAYPSRHAVKSGRLPSAAPGLAGPPELPGLFAIADPRRTGHCGTERSCVRAFTIDRPRFVIAGILRPGSAASPAWAGRPVAAAADSTGSLRGRLPGREAGRLGTGRAAVPGQGPAEVAGPAGDGAVADPAARDRKRGHGHGEAAELGWLIRSGDARPVAVTLPCAARTPHGTDEAPGLPGG